LASVANIVFSGGFVADLSRQELHQLARLGAKARLEELRQEEAAIRRAFPELFGARGAGRSASADSGVTVRRRRRGMSAAGRKAVSERMKKYWAERRKSKKKSG
jgi:hypothetical protein